MSAELCLSGSTSRSSTTFAACCCEMMIDTGPQALAWILARKQPSRAQCWDDLNKQMRKAEIAVLNRQSLQRFAEELCGCCVLAKTGAPLMTPKSKKSTNIQHSHTMSRLPLGTAEWPMLPSAIHPQSPSEGSIDGDASINRQGHNTKLYKTELCRSWQQNGYCNYGDRCQYAHGTCELRPIPRHPKYKSEQCRTFHETGYCPYGHRCHFVHDRSPIVPPLHHTASHQHMNAPQRYAGPLPRRQTDQAPSQSVLPFALLQSLSLNPYAMFAPSALKHQGFFPHGLTTDEKEAWLRLDSAGESPVPSTSATTEEGDLSPASSESPGLLPTTFDHRRPQMFGHDYGGETRLLPAFLPCVGCATGNEPSARQASFGGGGSDPILDMLMLDVEQTKQSKTLSDAEGDEQRRQSTRLPVFTQLSGV